ncbi:MAG: exodeoxyribonuclease VII small subunit [Clostridia bacterium]|nr:exodeoxyribonuclease VII small subunit [Clostridia bacterium]MBQ4543572.1 exodeoxyribonuclease VII small subunit [Clostridia bacterium]MBQ7075744.1 exodeoxyribonuclease VII small subunit [Clostridia bacterium]
MADFEKSIKELDEIVKKLEQGDLPLDEMLELFEKGVALSSACNKLLDEAEKKINILVKKDGEILKQEFKGLDE